MNVALVVLHADPARGGRERYVLDLAGALARRGQAVSVLACSFAPQFAPFDCVPLAARGATRLGRYTSFLNRLDRRLDGTPYDIVHAALPVRRCHVYQPHELVAAVAAQRQTAPAGLHHRLQTVTGRLNRKRRGVQAVEARLLQSDHPPVVLCLSNAMKEAVRRFYGIDERRLVVLPVTPDLARFDPDTVAPQAVADLRLRFGLAGRTVALMIAQNFALKGLDTAIQALAAVGQPNLVLVVVGRPDPAPYRRLARKLGVQGQVVFAGPAADTVPYYAAADFFVLPTRRDSCSLVVLEALAMGLPAVSTAANGACELIADGRQGFVIQDAADAAALAHAMRSLLDPRRRHAMAQDALKLRGRLSHDDHVDRVLGAYRLAALNKKLLQ